MKLGDNMGREQTRKQAKKSNKSVKEVIEKEDLNSSAAVFKLMKILTIILFLLIIIYLLVGIFITKEIKFGDKEKEKETNTFSSNNILASEIFKMSEEQYFLYFYDFNESNTEIESAILNKMSNYKVYRIDTSSAFNSKYVSDVGNSEFQSLEELKVVSPTMVKIENDKNVKYVSGEINIINYINNN